MFVFPIAFLLHLWAFICTMVACSSSVLVIARSNPSQVTPLLKHVGKSLNVMLAVKRSVVVAPEVDLGECTSHSPPQKMWIRQNPFWLWNPEETSPEIRNRGTSGPTKGHVSAKNVKKSFHHTPWPIGLTLLRIQLTLTDMCLANRLLLLTKVCLVHVLYWSLSTVDISKDSAGICY